jgi:hypothetical protein
VQELWFENGPLDMGWINKFMVTGLMVLYKMNRFHAVLELGEGEGTGAGGNTSRYSNNPAACWDPGGNNQEVSAHVRLH